MNNNLTLTIFLDVLILLMNIRDEETVALIDSLIDVYSEELRLNRSINGVLVTRFLKLLQELRKLPRGDEGDAARMSLIANFIVNNKDIDQEDHLFFESMQNIFEAAKAAKQSAEILKDKKRKIKNVVNYTKFKRISNRMYGKLSEFLNTSDTEQQGDHLADVVNLARTIVDTVKGDLAGLSNGAEERVVFSDRNSLKEALEKALASETGTKVMKTGLQGLNLMLGHRGGFALGEWVIIYGLSHHFKTGLLLTITRGLAKYNDPSLLVEKDKKPLLLFISLENYANRNTLWFYKTAYACIYQKKPDPKMPIDEVVSLIQDFYTKNGWEFIVEMYKGMNFGYDEYVSTIEKYEALGYKVVACMVDYMEKMKKKSSQYTGDSDSHEALKTLAQGMFDYNKAKEILFITPHQFNRKMQEVADRVKTNVVKQFSADGVGGSIAVNQIADLEIYVYIEKDLDKQYWLTVKRGKHRYVDDTKDAYRYFAYPFDEELGILDDIDKKKGFVRDIYSGNDAKSEQKQEQEAKEYQEALADNNF